MTKKLKGKSKKVCTEVDKKDGERKQPDFSFG